MCSAAVCSPNQCGWLSMTQLSANHLILETALSSATAATPSQPPATEYSAGMCDQSIICFAKDWDEDPTSNNHVMRLLSKSNRVLWLNSIATRKPNLRDRRDVAKIFRK